MENWKYHFTRSLKDNDEGEAPVGEENGKEGLNENVFKNHFCRIRKFTL